MNRVSTANRLKQIMEDRNLKQIDILNLTLPICKKYNIKMNKSDISQYVSGKVEPSQEKLVVLGLALNVTETWLMGFDVPMDRKDTSATAINNSGVKSEIYDTKANLYAEIKKVYGASVEEAFIMYVHLDPDDRGEIRGEMKQMLKSEKYSIQEGSKNA